MLNKILMICIAAILLSGCSDNGPWNGLWGLKSGITTGQLSKLIKLQRLPSGSFTAPEGLYVETSPSVPKSDVVVFDRYTYWFGKNGLVSVSGTFNGLDAERELHEIKLKYGNFDFNSRRNETMGIYSGYTLTNDNAKLDEGIAAIDIDQLTDELITVRIVYKNYPDIGSLLKSFHSGEIQSD